MISPKKIYRVNKCEDLLAYSSNDSVYTIDSSKIEQFAQKRNLQYEIVDIDYSEIIERKNDIITRKDAVVILLSRDNDVAIISEYYAKRTKRKLEKMSVSDFNSYICNKKNIFNEIFVITDNLYLEEIENIISMNPYSLNIGIIWGYDSNDLLYKLNKILLCSNESCNHVVVVDRTDKKTEEISTTNHLHVYVPHANSDKNSFKQAISDKAEVLSFTGHGRDELLWLTKGVLCAGPKHLSGDKGPNCDVCGECFKPGVDIMKISDVNITNYFIQSCTGGNMTKTVFGQEYSLLNNFMDNSAVSYISTPFLCNEFSSLIHYYAAKMLVGSTVGEIVRKINHYYYNYEVGNSNEFFLIGDPHHCIEKKYDEACFVLSDESEKMNVVLEEATALMSLKTKSVSFKEFYSFEKEVVIRNEKKQELFSYIYSDEDTDESTIEVFANGLLAPGVYTISIKKRKSANICGFSDIAYIYEMGVMEQNSKRFFEESIKVAKNFYTIPKVLLSNNSLIGSHVYSKYDKLINRLYQIDKQINNALWNKVHKSGLLFDELCMSEGFKNTNKMISDKKCPYCGGTVTEKNIINDFNGVNRVHSFCYTCGLLGDRPLNTCVQAEFSPDSRCFNKKGENNVILNLINTGEKNICGVVSVAVVNGEKDNFTYLPKEEIVELASGEKRQLSYVIKQDESVASHCYWLTAILTFETEVQIVERNIFYGK